LRGPVVCRSAQANTKPNPIKATEIHPTTMMVSIGIYPLLCMQNIKKIIADPPDADLIEIKILPSKRKYCYLHHCGGSYA
jgi:hypothetical protein